MVFGYGARFTSTVRCSRHPRPARQGGARVSSRHIISRSAVAGDGG
jgi:hypothetical protein